MVLTRLDQIQNSQILRLRTGYDYLDQAFGVTVSAGVNFYGMPRGRIIFASGEPGVGKTRLAISVMKNINSWGGKILIFQGEVRPEEFKPWAGKDVINESLFLVGDDTEPEKMIEIIRQEKPIFVVIDSANMIDNYNKVSAIREILDSFKNTVAEVGCVCFMIGHLTKDGHMKGNSDVPHLVDVECSITKLKDPKIKPEIWDNMSFYERYSQVLWKQEGMFRFSIGKNRYGASGGWVVFQHNNDGITLWDSSFGPSPDIVRQIEEEQNGKKQENKGFWSWLFG